MAQQQVEESWKNQELFLMNQAAPKIARKVLVETCSSKLIDRIFDILCSEKNRRSLQKYIRQAKNKGLISKDYKISKGLLSRKRKFLTSRNRIENYLPFVLAEKLLSNGTNNQETSQNNGNGQFATTKGAEGESRIKSEPDSYQEGWTNTNRSIDGGPRYSNND